MHTWPELHALPHPPQFPGSVAKLVQKAVVPDPQAFGAPSGQAHAPALHTSPAAQATPAFAPRQSPEAPQKRGDVAGSTHCPPQDTSPEAQLAPQAPPLQTSPLGHVVPALAPVQSPEAPQ